VTDTTSEHHALLLAIAAGQVAARRTAQRQAQAFRDCPGPYSLTPAGQAAAEPPARRHARAYSLTAKAEAEMAEPELEAEP
jgi:hypothetical protein